MRAVSICGILMLLLIFTGCASGPRTQATPSEVAALDGAISQGRFRIEATWARPMASQGLNSIADAGLLPPGSTLGRIDIGGSGGYLEMVGDSAIADLPYFGERHMGGRYRPEGDGIKFADIPNGYSLGPLKKGDGYTMEFTIGDPQENYRVLAQIHASRYVSFSIASSHRSTIWYQGRLVLEGLE